MNVASVRVLQTFYIPNNTQWSTSHKRYKGSLRIIGSERVTR